MSTEKKAEVEVEVETKKEAPAAKKSASKLYVTTDKIRAASGRLRDPISNQMFTHHAPVEAVLREGSWLDSQVKAGLIKEFQS